MNKQRIKQVQKMQENVEDKIEEYKRRKYMAEKDEKGKKAKFNVKGVEFAIRMFLHQMDNENKDIEKWFPIIESSSRKEQINNKSEINEHNDSKGSHDSEDKTSRAKKKK